MRKRNQLSGLLLGAILSLSLLSTASAQGGRGNGYHVGGGSTTRGGIDGHGEREAKSRGEGAAKGYGEGQAKSHAKGQDEGQDERHGGRGTGDSHDE